MLTISKDPRDTTDPSEIDPFYDNTISNEQYFLQAIINGRFILEGDDHIIYDTKRNIRTIFDFNKVLPEGVKKSNYLKYEINLYSPIKKRRKIYLHKFVWMYYTRSLVPEGHAIIHKDDNIYNCQYSNLKMQYPRIEDPSFFDTTISDVDWYYSQVLQDRFEMRDDGNQIYDKRRDKVTTPGKRMGEEHDPDNTKKKFEYNIVATNKVLYNRKIQYHRLAWMIYHKQAIPESYEIHHIDHNRQNNSKDNLQLLSKSEHTQLHQQDLEYVDARTVLRKYLLSLKRKYYLTDHQLCFTCKRYLPIKEFDIIIEGSYCCNECMSLKKAGLENNIYKFSEGILDDTTVLNIRFGFHIMNKKFRSLLYKYQDTGITKEQLKDLLLGNTYTHLPKLFGIREFPYRSELSIDRLEYCHIQNAMTYGGFTLEEISKMFGRPEMMVEYVLLTGQYKEKLELEMEIQSVINKIRYGVSSECNINYFA